MLSGATIISKWMLFLTTCYHYVNISSTHAFTLLSLQKSPHIQKKLRYPYTHPFFSSTSSSPDEEFSGIAGQPPKISDDESQNIQWNLFLQNHARGTWRGTWTTYDFMGDILDQTKASVNLYHDPITNVVSHTHDIVVESKQSDCETCFDSENVKTIPVGTYKKENMAKYRCASVGMSCGPSLTRAGVMSTELILTHKRNNDNFDHENQKNKSNDCRLRVVYQHAPVWEKGVEPGSCPPHGLKLYRVMVAKESLCDENSGGKYQENPSFSKKVPPFMWHKKWAGTAWTWGEQSGDRGWSIDELEEPDAWHGRPTGDTADTWSLRLNAGGILLQCPRIITSGIAGICRVAWLPDVSEEDGGRGIDSKLLRMEASVLALEPIIDEEEEVMLGFYPPVLGSLRCDTFTKVGELENASMMDKLRSMGELDDVDSTVGPGPDPTAPIPAPAVPEAVSAPVQKQEESKSVEKNVKVTKNSGNSETASMDDIRNALKL